MKECVLFLRGIYRSRDLQFYKRLCRGKFKVAVDGGYSFFRKTGITPDLLIGDFDSLKGKRGSLSSSTVVVQHRCEKDATDADLALDYCLERKARWVDVVQPSIGEQDHFVGNLMLLTRVAGAATGRYHPKVRLINTRLEILPIHNCPWIVRDAVGHTVSVLPVSERIILTCRGTEFDVNRRVIRRGETVGLRNRVRSGHARFDIEGQGLVFHYFDPR